MPDTDTLLRHVLFGRILRKKERLDAHRHLPESAVRKLREGVPIFTGISRFEGKTRIVRRS